MACIFFGRIGPAIVPYVHQTLYSTLRVCTFVARVSSPLPAVEPARAWAFKSVADSTPSPPLYCTSRTSRTHLKPQAPPAAAGWRELVYTVSRHAGRGPS